MGSSLDQNSYLNGCTSSEASNQIDEMVKRDIVDHFSKEMSKLIKRISDADSRSISYLSECRSLRGQLEMVNRDLESAKKKINEKDTIIFNYKSQLSVMSEHLAALNEKIVQQKDAIDELTHQSK
ncbi:protein phosphatase 1 regulatory subunit 21-like [Panonychus citri]|uniref:protein phosphatase 1 regulatory subunit 21-like n=1 Tax=Panonychus citri TaxID=50023 RepID=UPI0023075CD6|nr:protein phosphatase 1 regulatory subunit 21-like [Panonychus citri]